jgi:hypothetical protein
MNTLNKISDDNLGGILKLWLVPSYNILSVVRNVTTGIYTIEIDDEDKNWLIYCTAESLNYTENENTSLGQPFYECTLNGFIPNDSPELTLQLEQLKSRPWIAFFMDQQEYTKMVGEVECPLELTRQFGTREKIAERKGHDITLKGNTILGSVFVNNPF